MKRQDISDLKLERYLLGELPPGEMKILETLLKQDPAAAQRLEALKRSNDEIVKKYPSTDMVEKIKHRLSREILYSKDKRNIRGNNEEKQGFFWRFQLWVPVLSAAVLAAVIIPLFLLNSNGNDYRYKGQVSLLVYRKTATGEELLKNGDPARQGDVLQLGYTSGKQKYGAIFSIDGKGNLTWHFPAKLQDDTALAQGKRTLLRESYELDNAPEFERFFFIQSADRINLSNVIRNAGILAKEPASSAEKSRELFQDENVIVLTLIKRN